MFALMNKDIFKIKNRDNKGGLEIWIKNKQ